MNKLNLIFNTFFTIALILAWGVILFATYLLWLLSDAFRLLGNGMLVYAFAFIYALAFVLPIIFRKRLAKYFPLPLSFILFTILSVVIAGFVFFGARGYISSFSQEKWNNHEELRHYMLGDLEQKHSVIGKTEKEIIELIGQPTYIIKDKTVTYEYFIRFSMIDEIGYQIEFENGIATDTTVVEH